MPLCVLVMTRTVVLLEIVKQADVGTNMNLDGLYTTIFV